MDDFAFYVRKKNAGVQAYCDWCEMRYRKTGQYPNCCPGEGQLVKRSARRKMKRDTRKELHESQGPL